MRVPQVKILRYVKPCERCPEVLRWFASRGQVDMRTSVRRSAAMPLRTRTPSCTVLAWCYEGACKGLRRAMATAWKFRRLSDAAQFGRPGAARPDLPLRPSRRRVQRQNLFKIPCCAAMPAVRGQHDPTQGCRLRGQRRRRAARARHGSGILL